MASFEIEAMVRGYHIYKDVWSAVIDEEFPCKSPEKHGGLECSEPFRTCLWVPQIYTACEYFANSCVPIS